MMQLQKQHKSWGVLITKPKWEKKVASQLQQLGIEAFCPIRKEVRQWSDRKKKVEVALLPSMVLVNIKPKERNFVFDITGVIRYLYWLGKPAIVTEREVEVLKEVAQQTYKSLSVEQLQPGSIVDLKKLGLLADKGVVKYVSKNQCWVVLNSLGYVIKLQKSQAKIAKEQV